MTTFGDSMKLENYIQQTARLLDSSELYFGHGTANAVDETFHIVYGMLGIGFSDTNGSERDLSAAEIAKLDDLVQRRIEQRIPAAYIVGKAWFAGHEFHCDQRALVPRSPIAELILGDFEPLLSRPATKVLDLCAGGGSIGIATALQWPRCKVDLVDISEQALALARANIALHGLENRVSVLHSNLFESVNAAYDLIVANPPYVSNQEYAQLPVEYSHEPALGLIGADEGLQIPLQILHEAADYLSDSGLLVMEVGYSHEALSQRLHQVPLLWLEFEHGGEGVLTLRAEQLQQYREQFN